MNAIDKKEYLKKYLSSSADKEKKKKKKKKLKAIASRVKIIDDDAEFQTFNDAVEEDLLGQQEDAPQIAGVIDERPLELRMDDFKQDDAWKPVSIAEELKAKAKSKRDQLQPAENYSMESCGDYSVRNWDESPTRSNSLNTNSPQNRYDDDESPPRRKQYDSDESPPRKKKYDNDESPPRKKKYDNDKSPPRKKKFDDDKSPPRRKQYDDESPPRRKQYDDESPPRRKQRDNDNSPPRRKQHDESSQKRKQHDESPPRRKQRDSDESPPRSKQRKDDGSPPRRNQRNDDESPPRRKQRENDVSPPRKKQYDDASPPRRKQYDDASPPRRKHPNDDQSPSRKKKYGDSPPRRRQREDESPPRKKKYNDASPLRSKDVQKDKRAKLDSNSRNKYSGDESASRRNENLLRRSDDHLSRRIDNLSRRTEDNLSQRNEDNPYIPRVKTEKEDSPSSKGLLLDTKQHIDSSPPRRKEKYSDSSPPRKRGKAETASSSKHTSQSNSKEMPSSSRESRKKSRWGDDTEDKMTKTLDGKTAGLQNAKDLVQETQAFKKREEDLFKNMSTEVSGVNATTIRRDRKTGKIRDMDKEAMEKKEKQKQQNTIQAKYDKWGKGTKQTEEYNEKLQQDAYEMTKPLARYANDEDLERYLKEQERDGDPMLAYIRKKKRKDAVETGKPLRPQYEGEFMPNRFGIRPGHKWDGVDRSSGYEKKWFEVINSKEAAREEAYKWNTEDM